MNKTNWGFAMEKLIDLAKKYRDVKLTEEGRGLRLEYGVMLCVAAAEALALNLEEVTIIEFGVYKGDGLFALVDMCNQITNLTGLKFRLFGFDSGVGLPRPVDYRDHPEIWRQGDFSDLDVNYIINNLPPFAEFIMGDFGSAIDVFSKTKLSAKSPVAFVSVDCDLYNSATNALALFNNDPDFFLPATMCYFDDVDDILTLNSRGGEALAINEFNKSNRNRVIERKRLDMHGYFVCHILDHDVRKGLRSHQSLDIRIKDF